MLVEQVNFHLRDQPLMLSRDKLIWSRKFIPTMAVAATCTTLQRQLEHQTKHCIAPQSMLDGLAKPEVM